MLESLIALFLLLEISLAAGLLFTGTNRLAKRQQHLADMQLALRVGQDEVVKVVRMTGRGGLPLGDPPAGLAIEVDNDIELAEVKLVPDDADSPEIVVGTDVLTVRGVMSAPIHVVNPLDPASFTVDDSDPLAITGTVLVSEVAQPAVPVANDLTALRRQVAAEDPVPLILVSGESTELYAVVELDAEASDLDSEPALIAFKATGGQHTEQFGALTPGGGFPGTLRSVAFMGLLEEHRYYVRAVREIPGDDTSAIMPRLTRARFRAGTDVAYDRPDDLVEDLADNVFDLQIALGFDLDEDGAVLDSGDDNDEWLYNHAGDDDLADPWHQAEARLFYLRISTLALTDRPERGHAGAQVLSLEDHALVASEVNVPPLIHHRRQSLTTQVDLRNVE